jgi:hypothetical protein
VFGGEPLYKEVEGVIEASFVVKEHLIMVLLKLDFWHADAAN